MQLVLWRHAEAEDGADDLARVLTAKGVRQAQAMGRWLHRHLPAEARILASPAVRTQQTVEALGRAWQTLAELAPGASAAAVLHAAGWPRAEGCVLVVGHQPTLGEVAARLLGGAQGWSMRKGAILWFEQRQRGGASQTALRAALDAGFLVG